MGIGCWVFDRTLKTPLSDRLIYFGRRGILPVAESCSLVRSRLPGRPDDMVKAHPTIAGRHLPMIPSPLMPCQCGQSVRIALEG